MKRAGVGCETGCQRVAACGLRWSSGWVGGGGLVSKLCPTLVTLWTVAHQTPLSMGFPGQEYWSGLPFPSPGDLLDPGIEPTFPALAGRFFTAEILGKPKYMCVCVCKIH